MWYDLAERRQKSVARSQKSEEKKSEERKQRHDDIGFVFLKFCLLNSDFWIPILSAHAAPFFFNHS